MDSLDFILRVLVERPRVVVLKYVCQNKWYWDGPSPRAKRAERQDDEYEK